MTKALNDIEVEGVANMMVGYLIIIYYIICICIFIDERRTFVLVGTSESPGPYAKYDLNFQPIIRQNPENVKWRISEILFIIVSIIVLIDVPIKS